MNVVLISSPFASYRPFTLTALDRLASCLEMNTCGPGEKTVIILGSFHFGTLSPQCEGKEVHADWQVTVRLGTQAGKISGETAAH